MRKILVLSSDPELGPTIGTFLGPEFCVVSVPPSDRLMVWLRQEQPEALIADVSAPDAPELRHLGMVRILLPKFPIIIVSFYADELARYCQAGQPVASALFPLPFDNDCLANAVHQCCEHAGFVWTKESAEVGPTAGGPLSAPTEHHASH